MVKEGGGGNVSIRMDGILARNSFITPSPAHLSAAPTRRKDPLVVVDPDFLGAAVGAVRDVGFVAPFFEAVMDLNTLVYGI